MDTYPGRERKLALCLKSAMVAKEAAVAEFGIGEDLTFTLYGWADDQLKLVSSLFPQHMAESRAARISRLSIAATVFRQAWGIDEFVFMAEGFVSTDAPATAGRDLRAAFIEKDSPVKECITFTFVTQDEFEIVTLPYSTSIGRKVTWHNTLRTNSETQLRDSIYPKILQLALRLDKAPIPEDSATYFSVLGSGLRADGFSTHWEFE